MRHHLLLLSIALVFCFLAISVTAVEPDFADYDQPTPASVPVGSTTADVPPTPTKFVDQLKFWRRTTWRDFYFEYAALSLVAVYYSLHYFGRRRNTRLAQSWVRSNRPLLNSQFAQFGIPSNDGRVVPLSHDGAGVYESYATGRVGINRLWVQIDMMSRHDVIAWIVETVGGFFWDGFTNGGSGDLVHVEIDPSVEWEGFTWGVVKKGRMRKLKESRYDLEFTRITESTHIPQSLAILTELPEITDTVFIPNKPLLKAIEDAAPWLEYLVISDFPEETPKNVSGLRGLRPHINLVTRLPTTNEGLAANSKLLEQVILLVDTLSKQKFRPEVSKKLRTTRADAVTRFTKSLEKLEETPTPQELAQKKKAEKERAEKERVGKLSAEEQRKYIERERRGLKSQKVRKA